ncbi:MAG: sigma-70 family RNA polymerase sigma factor [Armatimonadetes bacterium]|nr:sigma-70 family RNA polymerase sigma factor [Armatimonadota bacterium]
MAYATAYRLIGDADAACDATQEAYVRAYSSLHTFRGNSSFSTWLYRIVVNVSLDVLRRRTRAPERLMLVDEEHGEHAVEVADPSADPQADVERRERQAAVLRALQRVSDDHRAVLVLFDLNGLAYEEIAAILGVPLGTVKSRLNRARLALRDALGVDAELFGVP